MVFKNIINFRIFVSGGTESGMQDGQDVEKCIIGCSARDSGIDLVIIKNFLKKT
jgi:hypothetical protein